MTKRPSGSGPRAHQGTGAKGSGEPPAPTLSGSQRRTLRGAGHHLQPIVWIGHHGVTPEVVSATRQALLDHELVKVKIGEAPGERRELAAQLAEEANASLVQVLGKTVLLYRPAPPTEAPGKGSEKKPSALTARLGL